MYKIVFRHNNRYATSFSIIYCDKIIIFFEIETFANLLLISFSNIQRHIVGIFILACLLSTSIQEVLLQNEELYKVSGSLKVTHYDSSAIQVNKMFALNQVATCKLGTKILYTR